ncbi:hypothetical protein SAMN05445871_2312 [Paraburkholderia caballeronis]|uniref:Uncharacterized protein n=1 Tax=Paraburkholderia caballeronis TaxID=416943 RepID=A0A1H7K6D1_9BURK|nr:hypothetical protein C7403_1034 [Paraburkholderia caballeronis]PXX02573.1 hypothetical protein C7407_1034 [Paraburkholderia caballeronis]RAK03298.1 hypothetical protein C7409_1034 [Paraburkholderia caballeronis]SEC49286.1 hypothetical protein SAMN05445871_2312 [Paraburkholderia caballeronis]SEK82418.1 hypothetical protein SAMN05192542_103615 [Paraburkholderia caballeronis]
MNAAAVRPRQNTSRTGKTMVAPLPTLNLLSSPHWLRPVRRARGGGPQSGTVTKPQRTATHRHEPPKEKP